MKSLGFSLLLLLLSFPVFSQYQFSNGGFETWGSKGEPTGWHSFATAGGTLGSMVQSSEQLEKSSSAHSGNYSALIKSRDVKMLGVHVAYANAMLTTGQIIGGSSNAHSSDNHNLSNRGDGMAMAFTGRPDSMAIWLKSSFKSSSQKGRIHVLLHDDADVTDPGTEWSKVVAVAGLNVEQSASWKRVSIPFYYKGETLSILSDVNGSSKTENHTPASNSIRPSYVLATIASNYMAGDGSANDVMYIDDVAMIYNSSLKSLKVNGSAVSGFSKTKYSYSVSTPYQVGCVSFEVDGRGATAETSYNASTYLYTITVKGDDYSSNSSNVHVYTIQFAPDKVYESLLTSLKVNGTSVANFSSSTLKYTVSNAAYATSEVTYTQSADATVEKSFNSSTNVLTLKVSGGDVASNPTNVHTYTITFHAPFESLLTSLKVNGTSVANFSGSTLKYTVSNAAYATSEVTYTQSADATVVKSFDASTNVLTLKVSGGDVATNPSNVHTYTITFHAPFESLLTSLKVNGTSVANFSGSTLKYTVSNAAYATSEVTYTQSADATVEKSFNSSTNVLTLKVSGGDVATNPTNVHTYTITFHAPFESLLTSLKVNGASVANFSSSTLKYIVNDAAYATSEVTYTQSADATVEKSFNSSTNVLTLKVSGGDVATNPTNVHTYMITFHAPYESLLTSLKVNGTSVANFSSSTLKYTVSNAAYATSEVTYTQSAEATVEKSFDASTNVLTLKVSGGDVKTNPTNVHTYTISFHTSFESLLTSLKVNGTSVANFSSSTLKYMVSDAAYATSEVTYTQSADATVEKSFDASTNVLTLKVSGGDVATNPTNVHTYTITFHAPFESLLTSLKVNGTSVANFSSSTLKYTVNDAAYTTSEVTYTQSAEATVEKSFDASTNVLTLKVSGGDVKTNPTNVHTYTVTFHAPFESLLTSLKVNGASVDSFSSLKFDYRHPSTYASAKVEYELSTGATASKEYDPSRNTLTLTVRGADYATNPQNEHLYHILFALPCQLSDLKVDGKTIAGFDKDLYAYTVDVTYAFSQTEWKADSTAVTSASYDEGEATLTIKVTGKDSLLFPNNRHLYTVRYHTPYTSYLSSLTDHGKSLPSFSPTVFDYEMDDVYARSDIRYEADEYATATDTFDASTNTLTITVKGGDIDLNKANKHTYTVKFHAPYTSLLSDLSVDGHTLDGFAPDKFDYQVDAVYYKADLGVLTDDFASYAISYDRSTYMLTISVKSGDFALDTTNHHEYRIQFNDHNVYNSELLAVSLNGIAMEEFSKETYSYEVEGSYADITLRYEADSLTMVTESFDVQENKLTITVEGGNLAVAPDNFHVYTFSFTQQFSYGAQITAVMYEGEPVDWFDKDVYEYTVDLAYNENAFSYTTNNLADVYEFFDEESLTLSVVVIGGDMDYSNMNEYRIHFTSYWQDKGDNDYVTGIDDNPLQEVSGAENAYTLYTMNGVWVRSGVAGDDLAATADLPRGLYLLKRGVNVKLVLGMGK